MYSYTLQKSSYIEAAFFQYPLLTADKEAALQIHKHKRRPPTLSEHPSHRNLRQAIIAVRRPKQTRTCSSSRRKLPHQAKLRREKCVYEYFPSNGFYCTSWIGLYDSKISFGYHIGQEIVVLFMSNALFVLKELGLSAVDYKGQWELYCRLLETRRRPHDTCRRQWRHYCDFLLSCRSNTLQ